MSLKIILSGATGAMCQMVYSAAKQPKWQVQVIAGIAIEDSPNTCGDLGIYTLGNLPEALAKGAQCIVDFSHPMAVPGLLTLARQHRIPLVLCTTGLSEETQALVAAASAEIPIFQSGNMSYGINLLEHVLKQIAPRLHPHFDIEIIEKHHSRKIDAPSGTALMLANAMISSIPELRVQTGRSGYDNKRQPNDITLHAVRGGTIVGEHAVLFAGNRETLTLTHQAESRDVFAEGALRAANFLANKGPGLYNMHNLIAEESSHGTI